MKTYRLADLPGRIAANIVVNPGTGCWEWQGAPTKAGYGRVWWEGKPRSVHRIVFQLLVGPIPAETPMLDHVREWGCRSRLCCWPAHLEPVTKSINSIRTRGGYPNRKRAA